MTEVEWLVCTEPWKMQEFLDGEVSDRRLRLFACACCRRIWDLFDDLQRRTVEFIEQFADGPGRDIFWLGSGNWQMRRLSCLPEHIERGEGWAALASEVMAEQVALAEEAPIFYYDTWNPHTTAASLLHFRYDMPSYVPQGAAALRTAPYPYWQHKEVPTLTRKQERHWLFQRECERAIQCSLFRDIFGNPFRPVSLDPAWRTSTVVSLAQAAYEGSILPAGTLDPDRLAVLADALEEAGCDNPDILSHLRGPGPHYRGGFALDLLLSKE